MDQFPNAMISVLPFDEFSEKEFFGLHVRSARRNFFVSEKNIKLRLSFALSMINNCQTYWNNILFADGSIFGSDERIIIR
jgi:prepilin-type processing-associated H-X9-DG protein